MPHTTVTRRRPTRPGAPIHLVALELGESNLEEQELIYSLEESGIDLRRALSVLARTVAGVMHGNADPLSEAIDLLDEFKVLVPEVSGAGRDGFGGLGVAA